MKTDLIKAFKLTLAFCLLLSVGYIGVLRMFAKLEGPANGSVEMLSVKNREVGAVLVGQAFTRNDLFWGRPSAVDYKADGSGGSNYGPDNSEYLAIVKKRIDKFLMAHPYLKREEVPAELVTASGSGLDPHIPVKAAYVQIERVADARHLSVTSLRALVDELAEKPIGGPSVVNVLKLNVNLIKITE